VANHVTGVALAQRAPARTLLVRGVIGRAGVKTQPATVHVCVAGLEKIATHRPAPCEPTLRIPRKSSDV